MSSEKYELPTVVEWCSNCETEIELRWDVKTMGYQAFCPVCGETLMLCDECRHRDEDGGIKDDCDWDSATERCRFSRSGCKGEKEKKYFVWLTKSEYGAVRVYAKNSLDAEKKAKKMYSDGNIDWHEEELTDIEVQKE